MAPREKATEKTIPDKESGADCIPRFNLTFFVVGLSSHGPMFTPHGTRRKG